MNLRANDPSVIRLIGICDPHLSAHNPPSWKLPYNETTEAAARSVFTHAEKIKADAILWAGDVFHLKSPTRNPLWFMGQTTELFRSAPCPHLGIAGNHDVKFGSLAGLKGQPLDLLIRAGLFHLLDPDPVTIETADGFRVRVCGASYGFAKADGLLALDHGPETRTVALAHLWFGPQSGELFGEPVYGPDTLDKAAADIMLIGHHHEEQGVVESGPKTYLAPGSMTRTGMHKHDITRRPGAVLITLSKTKTEVTMLRPRFPDAADHLDLERREQLVQERLEVQEFTRAMTEINAQADADPRKLLEGMELTAAVRELVEEYLEQAENQC